MPRFSSFLACLFVCLAAGTPDSGIPASVTIAEPPSETSPSNHTMPGTISNCKKWYTVKKGDTCYEVTKDFGITMEDFLRYNPKVSKDCLENFWVDYSYCVGVGETTTVPTTTKTTTVVTSTTTKPTSVPTSVPTSSIPTSVPPTTNATYSVINPITSYNLTAPPTDTAWPPTRTQPGQPKNCNKWHQASAGDTCDRIAARYAAWLTYEELLKWNPGLAEDCQNPFVGWWVCVGANTDTSLGFEYPTGNPAIPDPTPYTSTPIIPITDEFTATPTQSRMASGCSGFHYATMGDTCSSILSVHNYMSEEDLHEWNPALKDDCAGLLTNYCYCVAAYPSGSAPMPPTVTTTPSPAQSDTAPNCKAWYLASDGDTCDFIAAIFGTFSVKDFIAWNPDVWDDCSNIEDDFWYCVADPNTPPTRTAPLPTDMFPTTIPNQPNVIQSCTAWWLVSTIDTCQSIVKVRGSSLDKFYAMNPDVVVDRECSNLPPDYEVCVDALFPSSIPASSGPVSPAGYFPTMTTMMSTKATCAPASVSSPVIMH